MNNENQEARKAYVKPEIRRVTLKPEETLVAGCKTLSGGSASSVSPCSASSCFAVGS
jgi:hypothetical protein